MANSWDTCGEEKSQVNLEGQCRAGSSPTVQLMLQGWFKCDAPLEQNQVVTELWSHNCWVSDTAQLSATQTANTNMVRAEQHLRMNHFSSAPIMEPPEIITPDILPQLSQQVCPPGFLLAAQRGSRQKGCSQPAVPSHQSLGEITSSCCRF